MKKTSTSQSAFFNPRVLLGFVLCPLGLLLALLGFSVYSSSSAQAATPNQGHGQPTIGTSYFHDVSPALRDVQQGWPLVFQENHEAAENPKIPNSHVDSPDTVIQSTLSLLAPHIPAPILNFDGIPFPGVACNCAPPDTNGSVGTTQYVQMVNKGYQVFDKATGNSILGPNSIQSLWTGFGGACELHGFGDPTVVFDKAAQRWVITEFASPNGSLPVTDYCAAVSTSSDATGTYNRYGFHLTSNFIDYPKLGVWPDAYYLSVNLFNSSGTVYLGPQPFAFDRAKMIAGAPLTTFISFPALGGSVAPMLPADLDGRTKPARNAPNSYVGWPDAGHYNVYHFSVGVPFGTGATFTTFATPAAAPFTVLCPTTRACVPQLGGTGSNAVDGIGDRLMYRLAYRKFRDGHESLVGNYTVKSNNVAGIRWFELRGVTAGPVTVFQESTYQPDTTWRWMGSVAMDRKGNMALGFSASDATIHPQVRYVGRLATDPINTLSGEQHLFDGAGSQTDTVNRWGDYSSMAIDPVDDSTFWYTQEYYSTTSTFNWRTRIGNFKF